jgi:hypothetical protein
VNTEILKSITIKRRIVVALTLALYLSIWSFLFYAAHTVTEGESDAAFGLGLILIAVLTFLPYFITYIILFAMNDGIKRKDYLIGLIIILLPVIFAIVDIKSGNLK